MKSRKIQNYLEYFLFRSISSWLRAMPLERAIAMHHYLGKFWFDHLKIRRGVTEENIRRAFPQFSQQQVEDLARRCFYHYSRVAIEQILLPKILLRALDDFVRGANWEVLDEALQEGRGAILVGGHIGNWELMGSTIAIRGYPVWGVAMVQRNKLVDHLINEHRRVSGVKVIPKGEARQQIPAVLAGGGLLGLVSDQDAGTRGVFVPFLGRPASTPAGAAVYTLRYRVPLIYVASYLDNGKYRFHFERLPTESFTELNDENIYRLTLLHTRRLEADIRRYPEQWFWMHRRWKTRPPGEGGRGK